MLRITVHEEGSATRFVVEEKLVGPWVEEPRKCWKTVACLNAKYIVVDLTSVTSIDSLGEAC